MQAEREDLSAEKTQHLHVVQSQDAGAAASPPANQLPCSGAAMKVNIPSHDVAAATQFTHAELTGIQQHQVELKHGALDLADALTDFDAWTVQHGFVNGGSNSDCCPPADSDSPLLQQEQEQALEGNTVMDPGSHGIRYQHQPTNDDRVQSTSHQGSTSQVQQVPTGSCCSSSGRRGACVPLLVTCGDWDLKHLHKEAGARGIRLPPIWHTFCNVKVPFERWMDMQQEAGSGSGLRGGAGGHKGRSKKSRDSKRSHGMMGMLAALGLPHVGRHHSGLDDAHNIARIAMELDRRGVGLQPTGHIDPNTGTFVRLA